MASSAGLLLEDISPLQFVSFAESLLDALIVAKSNGLVAYANHVAETMLGFGAGELVGQNLLVLMPERYHGSHLEGMARLSSGMPARIAGRTVEVEALRRDGSEFPIELSLSSWRSGDEVVFGAIMRDLTRRRATELRERTLKQIFQAIAESETLLEGVTKVIETICHSLGWQIGTVWLYDPRIEQLTCTQYCDILVRQFSPFEKLTRQTMYAPGVGLPGQVFTQQSPLSIDPTSTESFTRSAEAKSLGLRSALGFPIFNGTRVVGVIELFSIDIRVPDESLMDMVFAIGRQLGTLLDRSENLEAVTSIVEQMQVGVMVYRLENPPDDRSLRIIAVNPAACSILSLAPEGVIGRLIDDGFPALRQRGIPEAYRDVVTLQRPLEMESLYYSDARVAAGIFSVKAFPLPNDCVGVAFENVTDRRNSEYLLNGERQLLEDVALSSDLNKILMQIAQFVEQQSPGVRATILRMREGGGFLDLVAAPSFPPIFAELLGTIPVAAGEGACGSAAFLHEAVVVENTSTDPRFEKYRTAAAQFDVGACWSSPILSHDAKVLGTLAMYSSSPSRPSAHQSKVFEFATRIAALSIEKAAAETDLRASEERLRALLEHSADAVLLLDREGVVRYRSPAALGILGYRDEEVVGRVPFGMVHPEDRERIASLFREATTRKEVRSDLFRAIRKNGEFRWLEVTMSNHLDHPILGSMILNYRDITERVEAGEKLRQQEAQYRAIVEAVSDSILILDSSGRVVTANKAALQMHGYALEEMIGLPVAELVRPADRQKLNDFAARAAAGEAFYAEAVHLRKDRSEVHVVLHGTSFLMGGVPHLLAVLSNVSETKRLQQRLERADRISSLGRLAATIAHEMNNVMMGIQPFSEIVQRRSQHDPVLQNAAAHIVKGVERGKVVTQEILTFTRATGEPQLRPLKGAQLLADVESEVRPRLSPKTVLNIVGEDDLGLLGDASQLQQVVTNLVMNAQDAMPSGGQVQVRLSSCSPAAFAHFGGGGYPREAYAHLTVCDSGHGIPPYIISHIFEPLFTTKGSGGTGLGLAIVHQIVTAHEGQIHVESEPGHGATFHLLLRKAVAIEEVAQAGNQVVSVWSRIHSVMLVEDEPSVGAGIAALLEMEGVECEWVTSGEQALERLRSERPDLLLLDVGLPDMSGIEVYRRAAEWYPDLPTIFSTGHGDHRLLDEFDPAAPIGFLSKPYGFESLERRVESLLEPRSR